MQFSSVQEKDCNILSDNTTVVTVTYGDRKHLLCQVLDKLRNMDISKVVVVDNGAAWSVKSELTIVYSAFVEVVEMGANTGSAKGFGMGIQRAVDLGAEYIWLLDDDNCPHDDTLPKLLAVYEQEAEKITRDRLAVLAFRPEHQTDVAMGVPIHRINPRKNSFRGFHLMDVPYKIWRRTPWGKPHGRGALPKTVMLEQASYSGLLFCRELIQSIGLPNSNFVLYADDNEFTYRIVKKGGETLLVTSALLDDLESSWNVKKRFSNGFIGMLKGEGDFRAYYGMRNGAYLDAIFMKNNNFIFWMNRTMYMTLLFVFSFTFNKRARYRLLLEAVDDGLAGRIGLNDRFPL